MDDEVKTKRRRYHSPLRTDQARQTRARIQDAAFRLFVDRGYTATTIGTIAEEAGVSAETIYLSFGDKRGLLESVVGRAIAPEEDVASQEDARRAEIARLPDAPDRLAKMVEYSCEILARTGPIHAVIRGAADKEPFASELAKRLLHERLANQTERIRQGLRGTLRPGLSAAEAGQRYCALTSPELFYMLTREFGWTTERHRKWLTELLQTELLARPGAP